MRPRYRIELTALFFALGAGGALGDDSEAVTTLKGKGLAKVGHVFVIEAEAPVLAKLKEARAAIASQAALAERMAFAEQGTTHLNQLEERRIELQSHLDDLNQQINEGGGQPGGNFGRPGGGAGGGAMGARAGGSPLKIERDQAKALIAEIVAEQKVLKPQVPLAKNRTTLDDTARKAEESVKATLAALRPMVDDVKKKYADLAADESVKKAMDDLKRTAKGKINLGPSDAFLAAARQLDQAERQVLGKKTPAPASSAKKKAKARK